MIAYKRRVKEIEMFNWWETNECSYISKGFVLLLKENCLRTKGEVNRIKKKTSNERNVLPMDSDHQMIIPFKLVKSIEKGVRRQRQRRLAMFSLVFVGIISKFIGIKRISIWRGHTEIKKCFFLVLKFTHELILAKNEFSPFSCVSKWCVPFTNFKAAI